MPNLEQFLLFREKYGKSENLTKSLNESMIKKAFAQDRIEDLSEGFNIQPVINIKQYFLNRSKVEVVLLFIDITDFSTYFLNSEDDEIVEYLDNYYNRVIPIINEYGGEIEKTIGDGIICVFGEPFLDSDLKDLFNKAKQCSKKIIETLYRSDMECKIALHSGEIIYFHNKSRNYSEYTMIGSSLTELFRLESISENNAINFYCNSIIEKYNSPRIAPFRKTSVKSDWRISSPKSIGGIKGVNYTEYKTITYHPESKIKHFINLNKY